MFRETRIYVPPVDGSGFIDDLAWFYRQITTEIANLHRTLGKSRRFSDYVITGRLMPVEEQNIELPPGSENDEYVLFVDLYDNALDETIGNQYITYLYPDENTAAALSVIIYNMLSPIPDAIEVYGEEENWRNKFIYLTGSFVWNPTMYYGDKTAANIGSVGGEVMAGIHFLSFLSMKIGANVYLDWIPIYPKDVNTKDAKEVMDMMLEVPAAVSYVVRLRDNLLVEPYVGGCFNLSLWGETITSPISWMVGTDLGVKAGPGMLSFDLRFSMDLVKSQIATQQVEYTRAKIHVGVGYKLGIINRKN